MGFFDDIVDMPNQYEYFLKFFDRYYRPEYSTIVVVGDIDPENVNKLAEKYFNEWKPGDYTVAIPPEPIQTEKRSVHLQDGSIPPFMSLNYKGPAFSDSKIDMAALDVLTTILFSQNSELYKKLVVEEQKLRFLGGGAMNSRDPYLINIQASFISKDDFQYVRDEITKALDEIKNNGQVRSPTPPGWTRQFPPMPARPSPFRPSHKQKMGRRPSLRGSETPASP